MAKREETWRSLEPSKNLNSMGAKIFTRLSSAGAEECRVFFSKWCKNPVISSNPNFLEDRYFSVVLA